MGKRVLSGLFHNCMDETLRKWIISRSAFFQFIKIIDVPDQKIRIDKSGQAFIPIKSLRQREHRIGSGTTPLCSFPQPIYKALPVR